LIRVSGNILIFSALMLLVLPLPWLASAFLAALLHELAHLLVLMLFGGKITALTIDIGGTVIDSFLPGRIQAFLSILAGPLCSLFLGIFLKSLPQLALCGMIQGIFNLLPFPALDGGRLWSLLSKSCKNRRRHTVISAVLAVILILTAFLAGIHAGYNLQF